MALGPQAQRKGHASVVKQAEKKVDECIKNDTTGEVTIDVKLLPSRFTSRDWETELAPKYRQAGWKRADWVSDMREGDYIHLIA